MFTEKNEFGNIFNKKEIRNNFIWKTFSIVGIQLLITTIIVFSLSYFRFLNYLLQKFYILFLVGYIIYSIFLIIKRDLLKNSKTSFICLTIYSFFVSCNLTIFLGDFDLKLILSGLFSTIVICLSLIYYAISTKDSFNTFGAIKNILLFSILNILISFFIGSHIILSWISGVIFGFYLIIDIQMLIDRKNLKYDIDDYGFAALNIYLDIINLFMKIMEILNKIQSKDHD